MSFCVQCGESLAPAAVTCPSCKRPVGFSSIGAAMERRAGAGQQRILRWVAIGAGLVLVVGLALRFWPARSTPSKATLDDVARRAAPSLVRLVSPDGRERGGVVIREIGSSLLVATRGALPPESAIEVRRETGTTTGIVLLSKLDGPLAELSIVLVPEGAALQARPARTGGAPSEDEAIVAMTPTGAAGASGIVLSFDDGDEVSAIVHDAPLTAVDTGYGFFALDGRLLALSTWPREKGEQLAIASSALLARLLVHEVPLLSDGGWGEHALPVTRGTRIAVAAATPGLEARLGEGRVVHATKAGRRHVLEFGADRAAPLQLRAPAGESNRRVLVVTLAPWR